MLGIHTHALSKPASQHPPIITRQGKWGSPHFQPEEGSQGRRRKDASPPWSAGLRLLRRYLDLLSWSRSRNGEWRG